MQAQELPFHRSALAKPPRLPPPLLQGGGTLTDLGWARQKPLGEGATAGGASGSREGNQCELGHELPLVPLVPQHKTINTGE